MYTAGVISYIFSIFGVLDLLPDWVKTRAKSYISSIFGVLDLLPDWVKPRAKSNGWGKKNRTRSCSRFAANLGKKMNEYEREREKGAVDLLLIWAKETGPNRAHIPDLRGPT